MMTEYNDGLFNSSLGSIVSVTDEAPSSTCTLFVDPGNCDVVIALRRTFATLSLVGSLCMMIIIWLYRKYYIYAQRLILYLSFASFMDSIGYLMGSPKPDGLKCEVQAWWFTFFEWAVLLWVCCITVNLYLNAVHMVRYDKLEWIYNFISWIIPLVISLLPFSGNRYGPAGAWCWIESRFHDWRFGIWYGPLFVIIGLLFAVYIYIIYTLNGKVKSWEGHYTPELDRRKQILKEDVKPLKGYPFVYLITSVFPLINRIQNAASPEPIFALVCLHAIFAPLPGALNAIVFGMDRETLSRLTWDQIKANWLARSSGRSIIHEYPILYRAGDRKEENEVIQFLQCDHINYTVLNDSTESLTLMSSDKLF